MSRSALLDKLRRLARPEKAPGLPESLPDFPTYADPVAQFRNEVERVSGIFLDARAESGVEKALNSILATQGPCEIYWESEDVFLRHQIPYRLRNLEAFAQGHLIYSSHPNPDVKLPLLLLSKPSSRADLAAMSVSATSAECGIAETGTVVEKAGTGRGRAQAVLAPAHVTFLREQDLFMNHADFFAQFQPGMDSSYAVLVTGPSRTADIEKTLVLGVHGPQRWYAVLTR